MSKFDSYVLTPEQQKMNLYPVSGMAAYKDYVSYKGSLLYNKY